MTFAVNLARFGLIGLYIVVAGCSAGASAVIEDGGADVALGTPVDLPDAGECVLVMQQSVGSACVIEWSCHEAGLLVLGCGEVDGGVSCFCGLEDGTGISVASSPMSCTAPDATPFARDACGWSWL